MAFFFGQVWREQSGLGRRIGYDRSRRIHGSSSGPVHLTSTPGSKELPPLASFTLDFSCDVLYDRRLWLYRQAYVHELSPEDAYASTKLTWPTTHYPLNCLKLLIYCIISWHALAALMLQHSADQIFPLFFLLFREGSMSLEAIVLPVNAHWPTLLYYLYETIFKQRRERDEKRKRRKFKRWKNRAKQLTVIARAELLLVHTGEKNRKEEQTEKHKYNLQLLLWVAQIKFYVSGASLVVSCAHHFTSWEIQDNTK